MFPSEEKHVQDRPSNNFPIHHPKNKKNNGRQEMQPDSKAVVPLEGTDSYAPKLCHYPLASQIQHLSVKL